MSTDTQPTASTQKLTGHPFNADAHTQCEALMRGLDSLWEFIRNHPNLPNPWSMSPLGASIYFHSTAADALRNEFGREGWIQERCHIWRTESGVRIEMSLPQPQQQPFVL